MMKNLLIFTLNGCSYCRELKDKLTNLSIPFKDVEITKNRKLWEHVLSQTGDDALPTVFIQNDNEDSGLVYTPGKNFQDVNEIIEIIMKQHTEKGS